VESVAYEDWMPEFQDLFDQTPGVSELSGSQLDYAAFMFEEGYMRYHGESPPEDIEFAREQFWDMLGYDGEYFDWDGWREAMGYELCPAVVA
jgi:hypothetical protein